MNKAYGLLSSQASSGVSASPQQTALTSINERLSASIGFAQGIEARLTETVLRAFGPEPREVGTGTADNPASGMAQSLSGNVDDLGSVLDRIQSLVSRIETLV